MAQDNARPPKKGMIWWPSSGTVILAGGGFTQDGAEAFVDRIIKLAGGPEALIVVIPTASVAIAELPISGPQPPNVDATRRILESKGAKNIAFLHTRDRKIANSEDFVKILRTAKAVFFTGGAARVLDNIYHGTLVERELKALLNRGGVLAGDSAGAITLGCFWLDWATPTSPIDKISEGLCVLPEVTVTPHVKETEVKMGDVRTDEVFDYITKHPGTIGINIQQNTFLVLQGGKAEVGGKGGVSIFDVEHNKIKAFLRLNAGEHYDFAK